jgi:hypothetical protein
MMLQKSIYWESNNFLPVKKFPTFHGTRMFITIFTKAANMSSVFNIYFDITPASRPVAPKQRLSGFPIKILFTFHECSILRLPSYSQSISFI